MHILTHQNTLTDGTITGGEPDDSALEQLKAAGFDVLISLRGIGESPVGAQYYESRGFKFTHLPISGPGDFTPEFLSAFDAAICGDGAKTAVFCATGNRVGAAFALHAFEHKGISSEASMALGMQAGLTRLAGFVQQRLSM